MDWRRIRLHNQRDSGELAEHVAAVAIHWRDAYGHVPAYLQLSNEPLSATSSFRGSAQEIVELIKRCGDRLRAGVERAGSCSPAPDRHCGTIFLWRLRSKL